MPTSKTVLTLFLIPWLLNQRWMILVVIIVLTGLSAATASRVNFDSSIESWFIESDPSLATYNTLTDTCMAKATGSLKKRGAITGKEEGKVQSCAAKSGIGK